MATTCRGCGAPMRWAINAVTGKGVPLDPDPVADGNLMRAGADEPDGRIPVRYVRKDETPGPDVERYRSHFSTCPNADDFRSSRPQQGARR